MNKESTERPNLYAYDFVIGILAALSRRGWKTIVAPRGDLQRKGDQAAAAAWQYLDHNYDRRLDIRFAIITDRIYDESTDWRRAIGECESWGHILLRIPEWYYELDAESLEIAARRIPGEQKMWDDLADVFVHKYEIARHS